MFWKLNISHKVKIFTWITCYDRLPTFQNLKKNHVDVNENCEFCQELEEDLYNALFLCPRIRDWWRNFFPTLQEFGYHKTVMEMALHLKGIGSTEYMAKFFTVA